MKSEKSENPLRKYLDEMGFTLSQFAAISKISVTYVHLIASNQRVPSIKYAKRIEKATNGKVTERDLSL